MPRSTPSPRSKKDAPAAARPRAGGRGSTTPRRRSICPVACTLDLVGDKWTLLVVRDLAAGRSHYQEFLRSPEGIATNILADRLAKLEAYGLVATSPSPVRAGSSAYALTDRGRALLPVLEAIMRFGLANIRGTEAKIMPLRPGAA
jgi:DNA-binding HxlR family transcriptional regulator